MRGKVGLVCCNSFFVVVIVVVCRVFLGWLMDGTLLCGFWQGRLVSGLALWSSFVVFLEGGRWMDGWKREEVERGPPLPPLFSPPACRSRVERFREKRLVYLTTWYLSIWPPTRTLTLLF